MSKKQKISSKKVLGVDQSSVSKNSIAPAAQAENDQEKAFPIVQRIISENFALYRSSYAVAILCMVIMGGMTALMAYVIKYVVNDVFDDKNLGAAFTLSSLILLIFFIRGLATFGQELLLKRISNNIIARYQSRAFNHMLHLGVGFYSDTRSAFLVGQISQNIAGVGNLLNSLITIFARDLFTLIGLIIVMIVQDPLMTIGSLVVMPIAAFVLSRYVKKVKILSRKEVNVNSRVISSMVETAQGIPVVKAFTMEDQLNEKVGVLVNQAEKQANSIALVNARTKPLTETLAGFAIAGAVAFGGWRVIELGGNPGALLSFLTAALLAYDPARRIASFRVQFEKSLVNARMLYELLDTPPRQADKPGAKIANITSGEVKFDKVNFSYLPGEPVLKDISFVAKAGQATALVGPSGGGKSTIINLILRFYDLESGQINVDGQDIADAKIEGLRKSISYVSQHAVLFEGSVADNIRFGKPDATQEQIENAAKLAQAHEFITGMTNGYETEVGELGANLSGGQKQRLSIARAILRDAPILLLDEATSALDNESEQLVQRALDELMHNRTTIVVAHRLSTIQNADTIIVIDQGKIAEMGNHQTLMSKRGSTYSKLHNMGSGAKRATRTKAAGAKKPRAKKKSV
ncbi:MAG: ABC transporter ATP-binding protein [Salaquimonas sp.]